MKQATFILAAIASALMAFGTAPAEAGGKRLQFGGPIGSFEATPYAKNSRHGKRRYSKKRSSRAAARKAYARKLAAKKAAARKAAAKKAAARKYAAKKAAARKAAARKAAAKQAAARKLAAKKAAAKRAAAKRLAAKKAAAAKARTAARAAKKKQQQATNTAASDEKATKPAPVKASAIAGTNTLKLDEDRNETDLAALPETEQETVEVEEAVNDEVQDEKAELECKKYIPSAGMTITVPCGSKTE